MPIFTTRLCIRQWQQPDRAIFAKMNADPRVMHYFPSRLSRAESDALVDSQQRHIQQHGWGLWACSLKEENTFIGFVGLAKPHFNAYFTPCVEIGWCLAPGFHGHGYATEAAKAR